MNAHQWQCCLRKDLASIEQARDLRAIIELTPDIAARTYADYCYHTRELFTAHDGFEQEPSEWPDGLDVGVRRLSYSQDIAKGWQWFKVSVKKTPVFTVTSTKDGLLQLA